MNKLESCPFCGGRVEYLRADHKNLTLRNHQFICDNCNTQTFKSVIGKYVSVKDTEQEAITAWNTRHEPSNEPLTVEQLRDEVKQLRKENRLIDENAASVQREYKAELERVKAERDKAVEDLRRCRGNKCDYCYYSNKNQNTPCRDCQSPISNCGDKWKWVGLEETE